MFVGKMLHLIGSGGMVLVTRLDWLARSTCDLLNILDRGKANSVNWGSQNCL
jgi:DNA invertase Pin-like site-specific DNA recombinase